MGKNRRVLVVDDYPGARYRRRRLLLDAGGFDVAEEMLGREALKRLAAEHFDLLIVDLHLPDVSGLDVCRALKATGSAAPLAILAVSAVTDSVEATRAAAAAGASAYVADDVDAAAFLAAVHGALGDAA